MKTINTILIALFILASLNLTAQVAISTDGSSADPSAMLEVKSREKGFLPPRMSEEERNDISFPVNGLIVYQVDNKEGLYLHIDGAWAEVNKTYAIGDFIHGGIVFWVDETRQHGLVCAKDDYTLATRWNAGTNGYTQSGGDGIYAGKANTSIIISAHVAIGDDNIKYAARFCNELVVSETNIRYGDWYLPSVEELIQMYQNKTIINTTAIANGGTDFEDSWYWSSLETGESLAACIGFYNGNFSSRSKGATSNVRAIRAF